MTVKRYPPISIGDKFERLTTVRCIPSVKSSGEKWVCVCDCGTEKTVRRSGLLIGDNQSCSCLSRELTAARFMKHGQSVVGKRTKEYEIWLGMRDRCRNPNGIGYHRYGGRGIKVCNRWNDSFEAFFADMGRRPSPGHSLDRYPDNNGDYEPGNCRWATRTEQARNMRPVRVVIYNGETITLPALAERLNLNLHKVRRRINSGWSLERALT